MGNYLSREDILKAGLKTAEVPYGDGKLLVRELSGKQVQAFFEEGFIRFEGEENDKVVMDATKLNYIKIASATLINEDGEPMFDNEEMSSLPFGIVQRVATKALEITDFGDEAEDDEKKD
jgi:hypothetical protein